MSGHLSLPLLAERKDELSKCAYCPKLCRASCVVSEQEPREALTPWGKMTSAFFALGQGEPDGEQSEVAWGCTGCFRCREACDHRNPVTQTLNDARADFVERGLAPAPIEALLARADEVSRAQSQAVAAFGNEPGVVPDAATTLLLGCRYASELPDEARAAIRLAHALAGPVRLSSGCCGAWQRAAGARAGADASRRALADETRGKRLLVLDPRCALELRDAGLGPTTLVELAARHPERFQPSSRGPVRYHDSCALGRGLGLYDQPRALLARVSGAEPSELTTARAQSRCSGAGGLLPVSMPAIASAAAERLLDEHRGLGGGTLVTSCASSLGHLRKRHDDVVDLVWLLEKGLVKRG